MLPKRAQPARMLQQMQQRRTHPRRTLHLFKFELVAPCNHRPPDQLIGRHNNCNHGQQAPRNRNIISRPRRRLQIRAKPRQPKVPRPQNKHLARHQKKPSTRNRHHRVPHQPNRRIRQFQLHQPLQSRKLIDARSLRELSRNALDRGIKTERHIPNLAREDQQNRTHLHANLPRRKQRHHRQHHPRQKTQHRNRLQNIQPGNHQRFNPLVVGRHISIADGKNQTKQIRQPNPHNRIKRIQRQRTRALRDHNLRLCAPKPVLRKVDHPVEAREPNPRDAHIQHKRPGALQHLRARKSLPPGNITEALRKLHHASISALGAASPS